VEWVNYERNANKLNRADHGPNMTISEDGFVAKHSGPNGKN